MAAQLRVCKHVELAKRRDPPHSHSAFRAGAGQMLRAKEAF